MLLSFIVSLYLIGFLTTLGLCTYLFCLNIVNYPVTSNEAKQFDLISLVIFCVITLIFLLISFLSWVGFAIVLLANIEDIKIYKKLNS